MQEFETPKFKTPTISQWLVFAVVMVAGPIITGFVLSSIVALFKLGWVW